MPSSYFSQSTGFEVNGGRWGWHKPDHGRQPDCDCDTGGGSIAEADGTPQRQLLGPDDEPAVRQSQVPIQCLWVMQWGGLGK